MSTTATPAVPLAADDEMAASPSRAGTGLDVVTGAFSYSGRAIAARLMANGREVRTLTGHPGRGVDQPAIQARPLDFDNPAALAESLAGATTLYNTYWARFAHGRVDHALAVENCRTLFQAARRAGVGKIVHTSILNPSSSSPYPYFRGKALVERALSECGVDYAILRPCVLFDERGVLINNIAWLLRHFPVFAIGGRGDYEVRPVHVDDFAQLAVEAAGWADNRTVDAVGPDRPTFAQLVGQIRSAVGSHALVVAVPGPVLVGAAKFLGAALHDVLLTRDEYRAMAEGLAGSAAPSTGRTSLSHWVAEHGETLGRRYLNELDLHFR